MMSKLKTINFIKRVSFFGVIIFVASVAQFYWSMGHLSESMSSACLECWFGEDVFYLSLINALFLALVFAVLPLKMNKIFKILLQFLLLISIWFFWNYSIFVERESSWSTFLFDEEIQYVLHYSVLPILVLAFATVFFINYKNFNQKLMNEN